MHRVTIPVDETFQVASSETFRPAALAALLAGKAPSAIEAPAFFPG